MAGDEGGAGGEQIAHLTEFVDAAARQRLGLQADGAERLPSRTRSRVRLSSSTSRFSSMGCCSAVAPGGQEPGGQAVGIDGDANPDGGPGLVGESSPASSSSSWHLAIVGQQLQPSGCLQRLAADDEQLRKLLLQLLDALEMADWVMCRRWAARSKFCSRIIQCPGPAAVWGPAFIPHPYEKGVQPNYVTVPGQQPPPGGGHSGSAAL